jgi:hypothetical protein
MGIYERFMEKVIICLCFIALGEWQKKLEVNYRCPVYCEVEHDHIYWKDEEKTTEESDLQAADGVYKPTRAASQE